jgi:hypothetical protein
MPVLSDGKRLRRPIPTPFDSEAQPQNEQPAPKAKVRPLKNRGNR